jgi:hypothetical protein
MSGITQAGFFPVATAGADSVFALLQMIGDEKKFRDRLTQLKTAEENANKVLDAAQAAQSEATKAQRKLDKDAESLAKDKREFEQTAAAHEVNRDAVAKAQVEREAAINDKIEQYNVEVKNLDKWQKETAAKLDHIKADLDQRESAVFKRERAITALEAKVHAKWTKIQEIQTAGE